MRKLASIQKITALDPIEGADMIETASILGWKVVVRKDEEFKVGDLVIYCEIDTVLQGLPDKLKNLEGLRVRTRRFKGQISQGICFSIDDFTAKFVTKLFSNIKEGNDVTEVLGFNQYEEKIPAYLSGFSKGNFPAFIPKTDETRVQVLQKLLTKYRGEDFIVTEKLDGSSVTFYVRDGEFGVCSRNLEIKENDSSLQWRVANKLKLKERMLDLGKNIALQGELIGEGVQSNRLRITGNSVRIFHVFDIDRGVYFDVDKTLDFISNFGGLYLVPIYLTYYRLSDNIDELVSLATIKSMINPNVWAEGVVLRKWNDTTLLNHGGRISFKVINPEYLIKHSL